MNITAIRNAVTRVGGRGLLVTKKYSPQILTGVGIVSGVTSTVLASKATLKAQPIVDDTKTYVQIVKEQREVLTGRGEYQKELTFAYARGGIDLIKLYAPAASVGAIGIVCIVSAQGIMQKRNASLAAAYVAAEKAFAEYRKRVEAAIGTDQERALRYGLTEKDKHDTKKGVVEKEVVIDPNGVSLYAKIFDENNPNWSKDPEYNRVFLVSQQQFANDLLHARGHVFLNDVYDALGIPRTSAGAVVGWVLSKDGDNFVDFGLYNLNVAGYEDDRIHDTIAEQRIDFVNGHRAAVLLDFNVDGVIFDKI